MAIPSFSTNSTFDPFKQPITFLLPDGRTPFSVSYSDLASHMDRAVIPAMSQGLQIGSSLMLLVMLLIVTKRDKCRSVVFILNALSLFMVIFRGIFALLVYVGPFGDFYRWYLFYYPDTEVARRISAVSEVSTFLLMLLIQLSLVMQVRIVCCNLETWRRNSVNIFVAILAFIACSMRLAVTVVHIKWGVMEIDTSTEQQWNSMIRLASVANIVAVISIAVAAIVFTAKLGFAIRSRRAIGMTQFGAMQIIFIMGCQTMVTPVIFTILTYWAVPNEQLQSFVPVIVALTLPLSAMWAAVNTHNAQIANSENRRQFPVGGSSFTGGKSYGSSSRGTSETNTTLVNEDLEMQKMNEGVVMVDRSYTVVRSD